MAEGGQLLGKRKGDANQCTLCHLVGDCGSSTKINGPVWGGRCLVRPEADFLPSFSDSILPNISHLTAMALASGQAAHFMGPRDPLPCPRGLLLPISGSLDSWNGSTLLPDPMASVISPPCSISLRGGLHCL